MPESTCSRSGESSDTTPSDWIKSNMFGDTYTVNMGRPLTDAEIRFQKCLEQLPVPSWYLTYSKKKPSIRLNCIPFDKRPSTWKNIKTPDDNNQRKSPKKRSPKHSPVNSDSESPANSRADSGFNETYRITRRTPKNNKSPCISITSSSSSDDETDAPTLTEQDKTLSANLSLNRTPRHVSFTFPRMTPSRKIENLNIVFQKPFPSRDKESELQNVSTEARTVYTKMKNIEVCPLDSTTDSVASDRTYTTLSITDADPGGVHPRVHVSTGRATPSSASSLSSSDEAKSRGATPKPRLPPRLPPRCSPSPHTRFFTSRKKSTTLEKIVQGNLGNPRGNLVQDIIEELGQSAHSDDFVRNMVSALEESIAGEADLESGSDSELAKSVDISIKSSGGEESADDQPTTPLPRVPSLGASESSGGEESADDQPTTPLPRVTSPGASESSEEEVYWIKTSLSKLPRSSSRISMLSRASRRNSCLGPAGRNSPGLSPIRHEFPEDWFAKPPRAWGYTYSARKKNRSPRSLFRIDETGNLDSGYSDTASSRRTAPSRTATIGSGNTGCYERYSLSTSLASSNTLVEQDFYNDAVLNKSGPFVLKSFLV